MLAMLLDEPLAPVTVRVYVPVATDEETAIVRVEVAEL